MRDIKLELEDGGRLGCRKWEQYIMHIFRYGSLVKCLRVLRDALAASWNKMTAYIQIFLFLETLTRCLNSSDSPVTLLSTRSRP